MAFEYDRNGHLTRSYFVDYDEESLSLTWVNGKLEEIREYDKYGAGSSSIDEVYKFTYSDKMNVKGQWSVNWASDILLWMATGFFGEPMEYFPSSIESVYSGDKLYYAYELGASGRIQREKMYMSEDGTVVFNYIYK